MSGTAGTNAAGLLLPRPRSERAVVLEAPRWGGLALLLAASAQPAPALVLLGALLLWAGTLTARGLQLALPPARLTAPLVLLLSLGLGVAWLGGEGARVGSGARDVLRDVWRYGEPVLLVFLGWSLIRRREDLEGLFQALLLGAALASAIHLLTATMHLDELVVSRHAFRQEVGSGSFLSALALALAFALRLEGGRSVQLPQRLRTAALAVCAASLALSFSRTWWLAFLVLCGVALARRSGAVRSVGAGLIVLVTAVGVTALVLPEELFGFMTGGLQDAMTETLTARSFVEPAELNRFWRSYEAYCAFEELGGAGPATLALGSGFGTRLDLGLYQLLDGEFRRTIPVLHNGYLEAALKVGLLGAAAYALWLWSWLREGLAAPRSHARARVVASLIVGLALVLIGTGQVVGGAFNPRATAALVLVLAALVRWGQLERGAEGLHRTLSRRRGGGA